MAIKTFDDHAANERTFLAWVRSSVAVMAFGFLVERFDLVLAFAEPAALQNKITVARSEFGHVAGLAPILLGMIMIALSVVRFAQNSRRIEQDGMFPGTGLLTDLVSAALLILLGAEQLFYLGHLLTAKA